MSGRLEPKFEWAVTNVEDFQKRLKRLGEVTNDFRIPFRLIASDFYRSQKQIFGLKSQGLYEDLSTKPFTAWWEKPVVHYEYGYKQYKAAKVGFVYPILVGKTRDLADSTLSKSHRYSIFNLDRANLEIGSSVPYGKYHQSDRKPRTKIPQRKFVFIDGGRNDRSRGSGINGRRDRWVNIIEDHYMQLVIGSVYI